jgi:hypothetical protein
MQHLQLLSPVSLLRAAAFLLLLLLLNRTGWAG